MPEPIQVRGPDGQMFRFPGGTDQNTMASALDEHYGRASQTDMSRGSAVAQGVADGFSLGFNDEAQGLLAASQADTRPRGLDRFRDDQGNMFTDALGVAGDVLTAGSPMTRGAIDMARGFTPEQQSAYEGARDTRREDLSQAQEAHPVSTIGGQIGGGVLSAALTGGVSAAPTIGRAAATGAGYGAAYGVGSGEGAANRAIEGVQGGLIGGVTGGAIQGVVNLGGAAVRRLFGTARPSTTQIDDALARGQIDDATATRLRNADDLDIPLTRGQQTQNRPQLAFEEAARRERTGSEAASRMVQTFDDAQRGQIAGVQDDIATGLGGGRRVADDALDATALLQRRLQEAARTSRQGVDDAYAAARQGDTVVQSGAVRDVGRVVRDTLSVGPNPVVVDDLTPRAARALQELDELSQLRIRNDAMAPIQGGDMTIAGVRIQGLERVRQRLVSLSQGAQADPQDRRAMRSVIEGFDNWLDDASNARLLEGTQDGVEAFQRARALFREHRQQFSRQGRDDRAGRLIESLIQGDANTTRLPEVANAIFGTASSGEGRVSLQMAQRVRQTFGQNSEEMAALRQGLFARVIGVNERSEVGTDALIRNFRVLLDGHGRGMANTLYTPDQLSQMRRLYGVLRSIRTPRDLQNPSGTAGALIRQHSQGVLRSIMRGVPLAGEAVDNLISVVTGASSQRQAREALRGILVPQGARVPGAVAGTAGYSGLEAYQQR